MTPAVLKPVHVAFGLAGLLAAMVALWPLGIGIDYYNHLARTYIEGHLATEPALQEYYAVSFDFIPDLTMDMIIPWLSHWIGIYAAGGVTIWLALVLPPLAGVMLSKSLNGRVTWLSLLGFLTVFNANMGWGFVNYTASSGLAVLAFALWVKMTPSWRRTVMFAPISLFLVANHALAFLLFGFLAFSWEVIGFLKQDRGSLWAFIRQLAILDFPAMAAGLVFIALSMQGAADLPQDVTPLYDLEEKVGVLFAATDFNNRLLALLAVLAVAGFFWMSVRQDWVRFAPKSAWLCIAFLTLVIVIPSSIFGIWGLHLRFTAPLLIVAAASISATDAFPARLKPALTGGFAVLGALLFANAGVKMSVINSQANALQDQLAEIPEGSKVLGVYVDLSSGTAFNTHALSLAVIERNAYVPNLFTNTSFVDVAPAMVDLHMPQANPVFAKDLPALAEQARAASENGYWSPSFANDWPEQWDYLLMFKTAEQEALSDLPVCALSATPEIILYKTEPCA